MEDVVGSNLSLLNRQMNHLVRTAAVTGCKHFIPGSPLLKVCHDSAPLE